MRKIYCVLWVLLALLISACTETDRFPIQGQLSPYKKGDIIRFTDNHGDTITLTVKQETSTWDDFEDGFHRFLFEERTILLQSDSNSYRLDIRLLGWDLETNPRTRIWFCLNTPSNRTVGYALCEENGDFATEDCSFPTLQTHRIYDVLDSVVIGNHTYYGVASFDYEEPGNTITSYYNKTYGVLQMTSKGETVFTLQEYIPYR